MESVATEISPTRSTKGLKGVLTKARRGRKDNPATLSINGGDSSSIRSGFRSSTDSTVEKLRSQTTEETGHHDGDDLGHSRITKLIPGRLRKKRRKAREGEEQDQEEATRGRSIGDRPNNGSAGDHEGSDIAGGSQVPLDDDGGSSLLTYDSDS